MRRKKEKMKGFTLIELVIVVAIVAIITVAGLISFSIFIPRRLEAEARKIISDLCWARELAVASHRNYIVVFEPDNERYIIYRDSVAGGNEIKRQSLEVDLVSLVPSTNQITFYFPKGDTRSKEINLSYQGNPKRIIVFGETGYVRMQ